MRKKPPRPGQVMTDHEKDLAQCVLGKSDGQIDLSKPIGTMETHHEGGPLDPCDKGENRHLMPGQQYDEDKAEIERIIDSFEVEDNMKDNDDFNIDAPIDVVLAQLQKTSGMQFKCINNELYREYVYADELMRYRINFPLALNASASGGHRVLDKAGDSHYIAPGWKAIKWRSINHPFAF